MTTPDWIILGVLFGVVFALAIWDNLRIKRIEKLDTDLLEENMADLILQLDELQDDIQRIKANILLNPGGTKGAWIDETEPIHRCTCKSIEITDVELGEDGVFYHTLCKGAIGLQ